MKTNRDYRTSILVRVAKDLDHWQYYGLMSDNTFQAGLDALDPYLPCYVQDRAIQECIFLGLLELVRRAGRKEAPSEA